MAKQTVSYKIARYSLRLFAAITLSAFIAALFGYRAAYHGEVMLPYILRYLISFMLYAVILS